MITPEMVKEMFIPFFLVNTSLSFNYSFRLNSELTTGFL